MERMLHWESSREIDMGATTPRSNHLKTARQMNMLNTHLITEIWNLCRQQTPRKSGDYKTIKDSFGQELIILLFSLHANCICIKFILKQRAYNIYFNWNVVCIEAGIPATWILCATFLYIKRKWCGIVEK